MIVESASLLLSPARRQIAEAFTRDEEVSVAWLLDQVKIDAAAAEKIQASARLLVEGIRSRRQTRSGIEAFIHEYDLSCEEGVLLMCLAEALLRIPDAETADRLIQEKLAGAGWERHLGHSSSFFVNASTWGLMLTGRVVQLGELSGDSALGLLGRLTARLGEPVVRSVLRTAMRILASQFVMGPTIEAACSRSREGAHAVYRHSFDMLGEAALTSVDADRYFAAYSQAIEVLGTRDGNDVRTLFESPSISIKLSALHPRYEYGQRARVLRELVPRLAQLAQAARASGIALTVDAEESERLDLSLDVFEAVFRSPKLDGWPGLGLAVQAYQKRAFFVIAWLEELATAAGRRIPVRLVKGAYWDSEIKRAQERGLISYPVYTRKCSTDVSYLVCAQSLLANPAAFFPQFATHNAHTVAAIHHLGLGHPGYEFQRLHGMGDALYGQLMTDGANCVPCRVYAPVGSHRDLLPYLVRRLLENGANTSFVNRVESDSVPLELIVADPMQKLRGLQQKANPRIPLPGALFGASRKNSPGVNLTDPLALEQLAHDVAAVSLPSRAAPIVGGRVMEGELSLVLRPADHRRQVGEVLACSAAVIDRAMELAYSAAPAWDALGGARRADILERAAELLENQRPTFIALIVNEGGRTIPDALSEWREAVDFCRYYAMLARRDFSDGQVLPGPTGESNRLFLRGRGVFACISPWNFPLAIFMGQAVAALAAGNSVVAKPAGQTPFVAARAVELLLEAGVPPDVLHFLPGKGAVVGARLMIDPRLAGVVFTGSSDVARGIASALASRPGPILPLIAETGGQNVMIVDSSALPEQVVADALVSAFNSAGQRCSALRVLFLQADVAPRICGLLAGAMMELQVGDPMLLSTDVGPVIDSAARERLERHVQRMTHHGRLLCEVLLGEDARHGSWFGPRLFEVDDLSQLHDEVFGPILHVIRYRAEELDRVIDDVNNLGFGLTLGVHTRLQSTVDRVQQRARVGNIYVNRNMIGAVVGVQPFGGQGLSGTGPKAGGPHYLHRFATEQTVTVNTVAMGGNTKLLSGDGE